MIDWVVANRQAVSPVVAKRYQSQGAEPVFVDAEKLAKGRTKIILDDLLEEHGVIRHNSQRLAPLLIEEFLLHEKRR
jgi:hypothetical protein